MEQNKRRKRKNRILKKQQFLPLTLFICALLQIFYHAILSGMIGDLGIGYYGITMNWILLLMAIVNLGMPHITSKLIRARLLRNQSKNVIQLIYIIAGTTLAVSIVLVVASEILAMQISDIILREALLTNLIRIGVPFIILYTLLQFLRGYFQSFGTDMPTIVSLIIEHFFTLICSLIFCQHMYQKGKKIGTFLHNDNYASLYGAGGALIGLYAASFVSFLFLFILFLQHYGSLKKQVKKDISTKTDGIGRTFRSFIFSYCPLFMMLFLAMLSKTLDLFLFRKSMEEKGILTDATKQWGMYAAKYQVLLLLPIVGIIAYGIGNMKLVVSAYQKKDYVESKRHIALMMRKVILIFFFVSAIYTALAQNIVKMIFKGEVVTTTTLVRCGGLMPAFLAIALLSIAVLFEIGYMGIALGLTCASVVLQVISFVLFMNLGKMQIQALVLADLFAMIFLAVFALFVLRSIFNYSPNLIREIVIPLVVSIISGIVMTLIQLLVGNLPALLGFLLCSIIGAIIYLMCLIILRIIGAEELYDIPGGEIILTIAKTCRFL